MKATKSDNGIVMALLTGLALAIIAVWLTVQGVARLGPLVYACFIVPLVAGMFFFVNRTRQTNSNPQRAVVFYSLTFFYVILLAGGIGIGLFSLR